MPNDREGSPIGVAHMTPAGWRVYGAGSGLPSDVAVAVEVTADGGVWAGTWGQGIGVRGPGGGWRRLDQTNSALRGVVASPGFVVVNDLTIDGAGLVWALNLQAGLAVFDPRTGASHLHDLESLGLTRGRELNEVVADGKGLMLMAAVLDGVLLFDDGGTPFDPQDDHVVSLDSGTEPRMTSDEVRSLAATGEVLYIGTPEGLFRARYRYDRASRDFEILSWRAYRRDHGLASPVITDIELDGRGSVWVGTEGGLTRLHDSGRLVETYTADNSCLVDDHVLALRFDETSGQLWIGTRGGLGRAAGGRRGGRAGRRRADLPQSLRLRGRRPGHLRGPAAGRPGPPVLRRREPGAHPGDRPRGGGPLGREERRRLRRRLGGLLLHPRPERRRGERAGEAGGDPR